MGGDSRVSVVAPFDSLVCQAVESGATETGTTGWRLLVLRTAKSGIPRTSYAVNGMPCTLVEASDEDAAHGQSLVSASTYLARLWSPVG